MQVSKQQELNLEESKTCQTESPIEGRSLSEITKVEACIAALVDNL